MNWKGGESFVMQTLSNASDSGDNFASHKTFLPGQSCSWCCTSQKKLWRMCWKCWNGGRAISRVCVCTPRSSTSSASLRRASSSGTGWKRFARDAIWWDGAPCLVFVVALWKPHRRQKHQNNFSDAEMKPFLFFIFWSDPISLQGWPGNWEPQEQNYVESTKLLWIRWYQSSGQGWLIILIMKTLLIEWK